MIDPSYVILFLIICPVAAGTICLFIQDKNGFIAKTLSFLVSVACVIGSVYLFTGKPVYYPGAGNALFLVDSMSGFVGIGVSAFSLLVTVYSFSFIKRSFGKYFSFILLTLASAMGAAYSNELITLLTFWGFLGVTLYLLVNMSDTEDASRAAKKALIIIGGTDAVMVFGIGLIMAVSGSSYINKIRLPLVGVHCYAAFFSILVASLAKAGAMPFHSWLPDVAESGPTPVTAFLPASVDKLLGIYLLARLSLNMFVMNNISNTLLLIIGSSTLILAVIFALIQHDFKKLLGYHAVSQVGYMILGIGTGNPIGIAGGLFHMLNHAVYKSCLFLSGGSVEQRASSTDIRELGGIARYMPVTFICFLTASMAISGIPPFNGFFSKWMIYQGIIASASVNNPLWIVWLTCAMLGSALTAASFMKLIHAIFLGRPSRDFSNVKEAPLPMLLPAVFLASVCVVFGVFAFQVPLPAFILPACGLNVVYTGIWRPVIASALIITGVILGVLLFAILNPKRSRTVSVFVGGEDIGLFGRLSGAEFYNTIQDLAGLKAVYRGEERGFFDIYVLARKTIMPFTRFFQFLHNGILPTYIVWCLLGMAGVFIFIFSR